MGKVSVMQRLGHIAALVLMLLLAACSGKSDAQRRLLGVANDCDAALTRCRVSDDDTSVSLMMGPKVKPLQPFTLSLLIDGGKVAAQSVVADFQMQGMDMGSNRYRLQPGEKGWQATATLPVCTASRMDWLAVVEFELDGKPVRAVFPFHTEAN
jgi:hypothetical protein